MYTATGSPKGLEVVTLSVRHLDDVLFFCLAVSVFRGIDVWMVLIPKVLFDLLLA